MNMVGVVGSRPVIGVSHPDFPAGCAAVQVGFESRVPKFERSPNVLFVVVIDKLATVASNLKRGFLFFVDTLTPPTTNGQSPEKISCGIKYKRTFYADALIHI